MLQQGYNPLEMRWVHVWVLRYYWNKVILIPILQFIIGDPDQDQDQEDLEDGAASSLQITGELAAENVEDHDQDGVPKKYHKHHHHHHHHHHRDKDGLTLVHLLVIIYLIFSLFVCLFICLLVMSLQ